jgi:hypothetical protein
MCAWSRKATVGRSRRGGGAQDRAPDSIGAVGRVSVAAHRSGASDAAAGLRRRGPGGALLTVAVLVLAACGGAAGSGSQAEDPGFPPPRFAVVGRWQGELEQEGLAPFRVEAVVRSPSSKGTGNVVRYSGIDCGGRWEYLGKQGATFRFTRSSTAARAASARGWGRFRSSRRGKTGCATSSAAGES